jgi:hypothetical protein
MMQTSICVRAYEKGVCPVAFIDHLLIIGLLVAISAFFSMSEISLAAAQNEAANAGGGR